MLLPLMTVYVPLMFNVSRTTIHVSHTTVNERQGTKTIVLENVISDV
jgi:hypothetical protein